MQRSRIGRSRQTQPLSSKSKNNHIKTPNIEGPRASEWNSLRKQLLKALGSPITNGIYESSKIGQSGYEWNISIRKKSPSRMVRTESSFGNHTTLLTVSTSSTVPDGISKIILAIRTSHVNCARCSLEATGRTVSLFLVRCKSFCRTISVFTIWINTNTSGISGGRTERSWTISSKYTSSCGFWFSMGGVVDSMQRPYPTCRDPPVSLQYPDQRLSGRLQHQLDVVLSPGENMHRGFLVHCHHCSDL